MILLLLACIPSPTDLPAPEWEPVLLPPHNLGATVSDIHAAGDVNGDGYDDILVGDCSAHTVSLYYGSAQGASSSPDWQERGLGACTLAAAGDVNGDGYDDLLVGAPSDNSNAGTVRLYAGSGSGPVLQQSWSGAAGEQLGTGLFGLGDLNGDGYNDLGITAWTAEDASTNGLGRLEVYYGAATLSATADWSYQYQTTAGSSLFANAPLAVVGLERQGDGYGDLAIGGTWDDGAGEPNTLLYYHGSASGLQAGSSQKLWLSEGELELWAADLDGDGRDGLLMVADDYILDESSYFSMLTGPVSSLRPVDLDGNGRDELVMAFPEGGSGRQTGRYLPGVYESGVTKPWLGLTTAAVVVPLGDINGDGSLDAALWDGDLSLVYGSRDADGDGFDSDGSATFGQDCNDQDATINPGS
ncbi:MAG TPA: VCBS repeat-containing protein, partial [Myxococcota bacterium]|nr:VCBS repeat-containing protein [Myxococcota bacterium]